MSVFCTIGEADPVQSRLTPRGRGGRMKFPMDHSSPTASAAGASRFELAPPRRFILPAILLLLSEQPGYGYELVPRMREFHFGHVDRPAVYRALAQLEQDDLVEASSQNPKT